MYLSSFAIENKCFYHLVYDIYIVVKNKPIENFISFSLTIQVPQIAHCFSLANVFIHKIEGLF